MTNSFQKGALDAIERRDIQATAERRSKQQRDRARKVVARFVAPEYIDLAAMSLIMLRFANGHTSITGNMVIERMLASYPWLSADAVSV
jgi:hypothetical protein